MNANQIIAQILRILQQTVLRRVVNWGVNKSIDMAARGMQRGTKPANPAAPPSPEQARLAKEAAERARQAARITRTLR